MSRRRLWELSVACDAEAEEALLLLLERLFATPATIFVDLQKGTRQARIYLPRKPLTSKTQRAALRQGLSALRASGLRLGSGKVQLHPIAQQNWAESWKRHFHPLQIGTKLLIRPSWSRQPATPTQTVLVLDPGLAFGTGQHPTTAFCLDQICSFRQPERAQSLLDVGTGTGILALAAAKLGYRPVHAFDHDLSSLKVALANARRNRLQHRVRFYRADLARSPRRADRRFDLLCANLLADSLLKHRDRLLARLADQGRIVLAGVLRSQFPSVRRGYQETGLRLVAHHVEAEWESGSFQFAP